jgi:hypothetical protein
MEANGRKKIIRIFWDTSPVPFYIVYKLVQALVIINDEIFQALAVEADVLLPKPFLYPIPQTAQPQLGLPHFQVLGKMKNHLRGRRLPSDDTFKAEVQKPFLK